MLNAFVRISGMGSLAAKGHVSAEQFCEGENDERAGSAKQAMGERTTGRGESVSVRSCRRERPAVPALRTVGTGGQRRAVLPCGGAAIIALAYLLTRWLGLPQKLS